MLEKPDRDLFLELCDFSRHERSGSVLKRVLEGIDSYARRFPENAMDAAANCAYIVGHHVASRPQSSGTEQLRGIAEFLMDNQPRTRVYLPIARTMMLRQNDPMIDWFVKTYISSSGWDERDYKLRVDLPSPHWKYISSDEGITTNSINLIGADRSEGLVMLTEVSPRDLEAYRPALCYLLGQVARLTQPEYRNLIVLLGRLGEQDALAPLVLDAASSLGPVLDTKRDYDSLDSYSVANEVIDLSTAAEFSNLSNFAFHSSPGLINVAVGKSLSDLRSSDEPLDDLRKLFSMVAGPNGVLQDVKLSSAIVGELSSLLPTLGNAKEQAACLDVVAQFVWQDPRALHLLCAVAGQDTFSGKTRIETVQCLGREVSSVSTGGLNYEKERAVVLHAKKALLYIYESSQEPDGLRDAAHNALRSISLFRGGIILHDWQERLRTNDFDTTYAILKEMTSMPLVNPVFAESVHSAPDEPESLAEHTAQSVLRDAFVHWFLKWHDPKVIEVLSALKDTIASLQDVRPDSKSLELLSAQSVEEEWRLLRSWGAWQGAVPSLV